MSVSVIDNTGLSQTQIISAINQPTGSVIQVVQTLVTAATFSTTSTSMTNVTPMVLTITPQFTTSKVLISISITYSGGSGYAVGFQLLRNGSPVGVGTSGTTGPNYSFIGTPSGNNSPNNVSWTYLDSPATTSAITYQIQVRLQSGTAQTFALNYANTYLNAGTDVYQGCYTSSITAQEIR